MTGAISVLPGQSAPRQLCNLRSVPDTTAAMATYAYDQIDQTRIELEAVSK